MTFSFLFLINIVIAFFLSWFLVKFGIKNKKYYSSFLDAPRSYTDKLVLSDTYKFKIEFGLSLFLIPLAIIMLALLSYVLSRPLPGVDQVEFFFMCILGEFSAVLGAALMIRMTFETIYQDKVLRNITGRELYITNEGIYFPIASLEGEWREIARKAAEYTGKELLYLKFVSIDELDVMPSGGHYMRPKPAYYKIVLKDCPIPIYFQRQQFYGQEKVLLDKLSPKMKINFNDQLRD